MEKLTTRSPEGKKILKAFVGATLISGTGEDPLKKSFVLVEDGIIQHIGALEKFRVPDHAKTIDASGKFMLPGLIDCHTHIMMSYLSLERLLMTDKIVSLFLAVKNIEATLLGGFTTIRDAGGAPVGLREAVQRELVRGPRLLVSGGLTQSGGHGDHWYPSGTRISKLGLSTIKQQGEFDGVCDGVDGARRGARLRLKDGVDFVKICASGGIGSPQDSPTEPQFTLEEIAAIVYEASTRGKSVMAHAEGPWGIKNALKGGVRSIEHGIYLDEEVIALMVEKGAFLVPTLSIVHTWANFGRDLGLAEYAIAKAKKVEESHKESVQLAHRKKVSIALGTDACCPKMHGDNAMELELLVACGLSPMDALVAATKTASQVCQVDSIVGTIEEGKIADLLLVSGDPLDDISILRDRERIEVYKGGMLQEA